MATFGRVEEYDSKEPWSSYTERLDAFFNANGIEEDEKKKWIFLSTVGTSTPPECKHINTKCYKCDKVGHLASCCLSSADKGKQQRGSQVNTVQSTDKPPEYYLHSLQTQSPLKPITMTFIVNGVPLEMELDSGSPVSIISKDTYLQHQGSLPVLSQTDIKLNCIRGTIPVQGTLSVDVRMGKTASQQTLLVVACKSPSLCGRDWLTTFDLLPRQVNATQMDCATEEKGEEMRPKRSQTEFKEHAEKKQKGPRFKKGDKVAVRNFGRGPKWWLGEVEETSGSCMVTVSTPQGKVRRHNNQVKRHSDSPAASAADTTLSEEDCVASTSSTVEVAALPSARRSTRTIRKPLRYQ
ncbi:hypothetical protein MTO96_046013 [Rhipicephalus appendiculatus]